MALINSQASMIADSDGQNDSVDNISVVSNPEATIDNNNPPQRRKRWAVFWRRDPSNNGPTTDQAKKPKAVAVTCLCKGAVKVSCLITCSSILELIGNLLALIYGIAFIQSACNFYEMDTDPDRKAKEYDEKLDRVLFLEKNRVGFVGLLATCLVGLVVAFLMPIGTVYRSWKSLRAAMSLLFSMCLAHIILASIYLHDNELMATLAAVPFRVYEIILIYNHIKTYKKKKRDDALRAMEGDGGGTGSTIGSQNALGAASFNSMEQTNAVSGLNEKPMTSDMQVSFDLSADEMNASPMQDEDVLNFDRIRSKERRKKRKLAQQARQTERKNRQANYINVQDNNPAEYK